MTEDDDWERTRRWLLEHGGFVAVRRLPDRTIAGVVRLLTTTAVCLGVTPQCAYERRFCFRDSGLAMKRFEELQSEDDTPTGWFARRPEMPCDRTAKAMPGYIGGDPALPTSWNKTA